jgi:hypothetical protein
MALDKPPAEAAEPSPSTGECCAVTGWRKTLSYLRTARGASAAWTQGRCHDARGYRAISRCTHPALGRSRLTEAGSERHRHRLFATSKPRRAHGVRPLTPAFRHRYRSGVLPAAQRPERRRPAAEAAAEPRCRSTWPAAPDPGHGVDPRARCGMASGPASGRSRHGVDPGADRAFLDSARAGPLYALYHLIALTRGCAAGRAVGLCWTRPGPGGRVAVVREQVVQLAGARCAPRPRPAVESCLCPGRRRTASVLRAKHRQRQVWLSGGTWT